MSRQSAVLVTGAATGIGRACALAIAEAGFLVFAGVRSEVAAESLTAACPDLRGVQLDVTEPDQIAQAVAQITEVLAGRPLAGLVNNAGTLISGPLEHLPLVELRRQLEVNLVGQLAVTQAVLPLLRASRGRIVNIGSTSGFFSPPLLGAYAASKHALEAFTDALRVELMPAGVHVAIMQPGSIATQIWRKSLAAADTFERNAPPDLQRHYGRLMEASRIWAKKSEHEASPPEVVARDVVHALTARRPRARYRQGKDAWTEWCLSLMPDGLRDRLLIYMLGIG